mmetsp:Transcript_35989/g.66342  ORF Transcript_35989/g.66342 Transcript_35989/m.66342 type:complete len:94 (+) Transcript_35989:24-305(+)
MYFHLNELNSLKSVIMKWISDLLNIHGERHWCNAALPLYKAKEDKKYLQTKVVSVPLANSAANESMVEKFYFEKPIPCYLSGVGTFSSSCVKY